MKLRTIIESHVKGKNVVEDFDDDSFDHIDHDPYDERFVNFLKTVWQTDYMNIYQVIEDIVEEDELDKAESLFKNREDIEDMKIFRDDIPKFLKMAVSNGKLTQKFTDAVKQYAMDWSDFINSPEADTYIDDFNDAEEYRRDPYGYHGVRPSDFH